MFSRRVVLQLLAASATLPCTGLSVAASSSTLPSPDLTIDSAETPMSDDARARFHIRLTGTQLDRYKVMKALFASGSELHIEASLDDAGLVLLEAALNDAGRALTHPVHRANRYRLVARAC